MHYHAFFNSQNTFKYLLISYRVRPTALYVRITNQSNQNKKMRPKRCEK